MGTKHRGVRNTELETLSHDLNRSENSVSIIIVRVKPRLFFSPPLSIGLLQATTSQNKTHSPSRT